MDLAEQRQHQRHPGDHEWERYHIQATPPAGAVSLHVLLFGDVGDPTANGEAWIDDVGLDELPPDEPYGPFTPEPAQQQALDGFAAFYDLAVVRAAFHRDAWRAARRWKAGGAPLPTDPAAVWQELDELREWYHAAYPLVHGQPGNGPHRARAWYEAECPGGAGRLADDLAERTAQVERLGRRLMAELSTTKLPWKAPEPDAAPPPPLTLTGRGAVRRVLFGGSHGIPDLKRFGRAHRLLDYDYEMQIYDAIEQPAPDQAEFHDERLLDPYRPFGLSVDLVLQYSNHGFEYCPQYLWPQIAADPSAWATPDRWEAEHGTFQRFPRLNVAHPLVRRALLEYCRAIGRHYRGNGGVAFYRGPWEPMFTPGEATGEAGRDAVCLALFRAGLQRRYQTIERLNTDWGAAYASFDAIEPPERKPARTSPLWYEFQRFRQDLFMDWWAACYRELRAADPDHPVAIDTCVGYLGTSIASAVDWWRAASEAADILSHHDGRAGSEADYLVYSYGRYHPAKALGQLEYVWNGPECWGDPEEAVSFAAGERNLWRGTALNERIYGMYGQNDTYVPWPSRTQASYNNLSDFETDYSLLRPCAGVIPLLHRKLNALPQAFIESRIAEPRVGVLVPAEAMLAGLPEGTVDAAAGAVHGLLYDARVHHAFVPEQAIAAGAERLDALKVMVLPAAQVLPEAVQAKLRAWVKSGGLLVAVGPFAVMDRYGRADGRWLKALALDGATQPMTRATDGKGSILLLAGHEALRRPEVRAEVSAALARAAPPWCRSDGARLGWVLREQGKVRYLVVFNRSARTPATETLTFAARVARVRDLTAAGGPTVATRVTQVTLHLEPGEGTVLQMD
ncbi:MAG: beta-galactosidase [Armatimonadetes bacterium]|nr:beta-galactosidase [Armatimonadota bacterium]